MQPGSLCYALLRGSITRYAWRSGQKPSKITASKPRPALSSWLGSVTVQATAGIRNR